MATITSYRRPYYRYITPVVVERPTTCRTVTNNQNVIDALQGLLDNCDKLRANGAPHCNAAFVNSVRTELNNQIAIGVVIGQNCNPVASPVITYRTF